MKIEKMRVGIITDAIDDNAGGIQTYVRGLVENILKIDKKNKYYLIHHSVIDDPLYKNRKQIIIPIRKLPGYREFRKIILMPFLLKKYNLDLVHETAQIGPFFLPSKFKKIITIHDLVPLVYPKTHSLTAWIHHRLSLSWVTNKVDAIIAVSGNTKKDILRFCKVNERKVHVIYEGHFDYYKIIKNKKILQNIQNKYNLNFPFILFVGTLEPRKNIQRIIKAFSKIKKEFPNLKLVIAGKKGWKYKNIFQIITNKGLEKDIIFTGYVDEKDLPALNNLAELLIYPSLYEGFGLSPLGAMKCGCPVLASDSSSLPEVVGAAGILVNPKSVEQISKGIITLIKNRPLRRNLIKKGLKQSKKFNWKKFAKQTIKLYNHIIEEG